MTNHDPLETVSVVSAAANRLRDSLFAGDYAAGEEIKDTRVASAYGIARPTARLAVQQLIAEGVLIRPPGFSARVRSFDPEEVRDLYGVRRLIELESIRRIREENLPLHRIADALQGFSDLRGSGADWSRIAQADVAFHSAVVDAAGSPRLRSYFAGIVSEMRLLIALLKEQYSGGEALYREHEELFELLDGRGTIPQIEAAWRAHLNSAQRFLEIRLSGRGS
ncbi:GntR family transcriptional regulator [Leucobacter sp. wl10]|uniref:GntR family transcriptional regulator n=1 Tax=Leucobacter sp. wl10 TaxID=2304677 RepID=UPI000E5B17C1|nr:GntR family transcriptional regulator [Leucobacter sp. wl10]RGE23683.1 GntR family transcriptional regulator [Leucobacter sp. wl10]